MNILIVVEACSAGVGRHVRSICRDLIAQGHQLTVAYATHRTDEAFQQFVDNRQDAIRFAPLTIRREVSPVSDVRAVLQLLHLIRREGPFDIVHGHSSKGGALARVAGRCFGIPTVYTPHSLVMASPEVSRVEIAFYTLVERILGHWATSKIIAVSDEERELVLTLRLTPRNRVAVVANGIDEQDLKYFSEAPNPENISYRPLTFGAIMRLTTQKAPGHLVDAFTRLVEMVPEVPLRLVLAGDGKLFAGVKRQVEESGLSKNISLLGWRTDTRNLLREFDVFVLSSLYEGFSYTLLEAMAAKLPIVSTSVFGTKSSICRVPGNIVVPPGDPAALAQGMKQIASLTDLESLRQALQKIGQANQDYVRTHFRQGDTSRRTLEIYRALCSNGGKVSGHRRQGSL